ncbi:MAG: hypothetical protein VW667_10195, partial [Candidatus Neomarinimicrobiota bacterium]
MLNFQIRGYGINLCAGTIEDAKVQDLLNAMRDNKSSLAQVMYDNNWREFSNIIESRSPFISDDGELIITSYNSKDYYDDGHSFFRSKIKDLAQIPEQREMNIDSNLPLVVNKEIYFGCTFESEIEDQNHEYFHEEQLSISSYSTPFSQHSLIDEMFFNRLELKDLARRKHELISFQCSIYKKASHDVPNITTCND